ncbi:MAG: nitroreductase [Sphingobacteriales bacterium]
MDNNFATISNIVKSRRSIKAQMMNGQRIPDYQVHSLLELADWAPTHGFTEPWRFTVYSNASEFCHQHAELYKQNTPPADFVEGVYSNLYNQANKASHVILVTMQRGNLPKIPVIEEIEATSCAIQNILLGATALGIASFWSTGGMIQKQAMKDFFQLNEDDHVVGVIYLGYAEQHPTGSRTIPLEEKITWIK